MVTEIQESAPPQLTPAWHPLRFHAVQARLWTTKARFVAVPAGRGSGKTELARRRLIRYLRIRRPWHDPRYFYGAPTHLQAKRIAWRPLLSLIPKGWIKDISISELVIRTVFGSELHVVGLDRPQRIEGVQWDGGVIDESCDVRPNTFDLSILPMLTWRNGWCWRIGVPKRYGVGAAEFRTFYEQAASGQLADAAGYTWPSSDILPAQALAYARESMDQRDYDEQFNAAWQRPGGGIFHAFDGERNVRPCAYRPEHPIIVGSDFNIDPMAWVLCHKIGAVIEVFDEVWLRDANTPAALDTLFARYQDHRGGWEFYGDATGKARKTSAHASDYQHIMDHAGFKGRGRSLHYLDSNPPQADRFAATNARICNSDNLRRLFIDAKCKHLIHDLRMRSYRPGTREAEDGGDKGHASDALGYILYRLFPIRIRVDTGAYVVAVTGG